MVFKWDWMGYVRDIVHGISMGSNWENLPFYGPKYVEIPY